MPRLGTFPAKWSRMQAAHFQRNASLKQLSRTRGLDEIENDCPDPNSCAPPSPCAP
jgi:hypothetical protein